MTRLDDAFARRHALAEQVAHELNALQRRTDPHPLTFTVGAWTHPGSVVLRAATGEGFAFVPGNSLKATLVIHAIWPTMDGRPLSETDRLDLGLEASPSSAVPTGGAAHEIAAAILPMLEQYRREYNLVVNRIHERAAQLERRRATAVRLAQAAHVEPPTAPNSSREYGFLLPGGDQAPDFVAHVNAGEETADLQLYRLPVEVAANILHQLRSLNIARSLQPAPPRPVVDSPQTDLPKRPPRPKR